MLSGLLELHRRCCAAVGSGSAPPVVTVAVSGGVDSAVCLSLLRLLQHHFHFQQQRGLGLPFFEVHRGGIRWEIRGAVLRSNPGEYILRPPTPPPFLLRAVHMRNWSADAEDGVATEKLRRSNNRREALRSSLDCLDRQEGDARELCRNLGIDLQIVDCSEAYWSRCFLPMLDSMCQRGLPLNPDVLCNTEVKFGQLLGILDSSTTFLATGHYAATRWVASRDTPLLCSPRGIEEASDSLNDQTYFLSQLVGSPKLCRALFPLGEMFRSKEEVRAFAREIDGGVILPQVAGKPTSTGLCFVGRRRWIEFASQYLPLEGNERERVRWCDDRGIEMTLEHAQSVVVGGVCYSQADQPLLLKTLTIGQKICFVITKSVIVFYVFAKDLSQRVVFIVPKADVERCNRVLMHTSCEVDGLVLDPYLWEGKEIPNRGPLGEFPMEVCVRHQLPYVAVSLSIIEGDSKGKGIVKFKAPVRAVTPQQVAVFRRQDPETKHFVCIGSGTISHAWGAHVNR